MSKFFDSIRVKPENDRSKPKDEPRCQWRGCEKPGTNKAPKGRGKEGQFYNFCTTHVRQYNKSYNYFSGMSDKDVVDFQKDSMTGHRPTWSVGSNGASGTAKGFNPSFGADDAHGLFGDDAAHASAKKPQRAVRNMERKQLAVLNLDGNATKEEIKARFKELAKRLHPDANGGKSGSEEKLREVISAYNYLKQAGLC